MEGAQTTTLEVTIPAGATGASETNLMEKSEGQPLTITADRLKLHVHPFEIVAFRADYPEKSNETGGPQANVPSGEIQ